jgi:NifU-like protein involved in Fe-S cluster formation
LPEPLYSREILRLAMSLASDTKIAEPDCEANVRSKICGSEVAVSLKVDELGAIAAISFSVRACAIGQASTAIVKQNAVGKNCADIAKIENALAGFLSGETGMPTEWPELAELAAAQAYPARHAAILLPYKAVLAAFATAAA